MEICGQEEAFVSLENAVRRKMSGGCCMFEKQRAAREGSNAVRRKLSFNPKNAIRRKLCVSQGNAVRRYC